MRAKLKKYEDGYSEIQRLLEDLEKDKDSWEKKIMNVEVKAKEISAKKKPLRISPEDAFRSKEELGDEVLDLRGELVLIASVYFERAREQVSFFYP